MHELELYYDNVVDAWVIICSCDDLGNWNYSKKIEDVGRMADSHLATIGAS